jgi:hypothetical protein
VLGRICCLFLGFVLRRERFFFFNGLRGGFLRRAGRGGLGLFLFLLAPVGLGRSQILQRKGDRYTAKWMCIDATQFDARAWPSSATARLESDFPY